MDHTPGQGQYRDLELFARTIKGYREDLSDAALRELVSRQQGAAKLSLEQLRQLADAAAARGLAIASHDDDSVEKLQLMQQLGARISEFPVSLAVAQAARRRGMHSLVGAPNVLLGHSHSGNLSAREAIGAGAADILCSDYHPAALLRAVFQLHHSCALALPEAVALVTLNPARATGIHEQFGEIAVGKRGDVLVVRDHGGALTGGRAANIDAAGRGGSDERQGDSEAAGRGGRAAGGDSSSEAIASDGEAGRGGSSEAIASDGGERGDNVRSIPVVEVALVEGSPVFMTRYPRTAQRTARARALTSSATLPPAAASPLSAALAPAATSPLSATLAPSPTSARAPAAFTQAAPTVTQQVIG